MRKALLFVAMLTWILFVASVWTYALYFSWTWASVPPAPRPPFVVFVGHMSGWCPGTLGTVRYLMLDDDGSVDSGDILDDDDGALFGGYCWSGESRLLK